MVSGSFGTTTILAVTDLGQGTVEEHWDDESPVPLETTLVPVQKVVTGTYTDPGSARVSSVAPIRRAQTGGPPRIRDLFFYLSLTVLPSRVTPPVWSCLPSPLLDVSIWPWTRRSFVGSECHERPNRQHLLLGTRRGDVMASLHPTVFTCPSLTGHGTGTPT